MSEYQYYGLCKIRSPLLQAIRKEMASTTNRVRFGIHAASYFYNKR